MNSYDVNYKCNDENYDIVINWFIQLDSIITWIIITWIQLESFK